jgi:heme A synthase
LWVSAAHATLAQLFFLTTVSIAVFTSRSWTNAEPRIFEADNGVSSRSLCIASLGLILVQLVLGATLRHSATWDQLLPTGLLVAHITGAIVVTLALGLTASAVLLRHREDKFLTRPAMIALGLLFVQLALGIAAYITRARSPFGPQPLNPMIAVTVAHVACGALVFAATILLTLRVFRVFRVEKRTVGVLATA